MAEHFPSRFRISRLRMHRQPMIFLASKAGFGSSRHIGCLFTARHTNWRSFQNWSGDGQSLRVLACWDVATSSALATAGG